VPGSHRIGDLEPDVVPRPGVTAPGIAQTNN
jgi:hypothetical protein